MRKGGVTDTMRGMQTGEVVVFEARQRTTVKQTKYRLREEMLAEKADWIIGAQNPTTGQFKVQRITRLD